MIRKMKEVGSKNGRKIRVKIVSDDTNIIRHYFHPSFSIHLDPTSSPSFLPFSFLMFVSLYFIMLTTSDEGNDMIGDNYYQNRMPIYWDASKPKQSISVLSWDQLSALLGPPKHLNIMDPKRTEKTTCCLHSLQHLNVLSENHSKLRMIYLLHLVGNIQCLCKRVFLHDNQTCCTIPLGLQQHCPLIVQ